MTFKLEMVRTEKGTLLLQGYNPSEELEYYDLCGEGGKESKISFAPWDQELSSVPHVATAEYDDDDSSSFWAALKTVLTSARAAGVLLPEYAAY